MTKTDIKFISICLFFLILAKPVLSADSIYKDIDENRRYNEIVWIAAHNAFTSYPRGWGVVNQAITIPDLLNANVRVLMMDIHFASDQKEVEDVKKAEEVGDEVDKLPKDAQESGDIASSTAEKATKVAPVVKLCHGDCKITKWLLNIMVQTQGYKKLRDDFKNVGVWLRANPKEIVTIIFESYVGMDLEALIQDADVQGFVFRHSDGNLFSSQNPLLWPTIKTFRDSGKRLILFSNNSGDGGALFQNFYSAETHWNLGDGNQCNEIARGSQRRAPHQWWLLNNFYSWVFGDTTASDSRVTLLPNHGLLNSDDLIKRVEDKCLAFWRQPPVWLGLDFAHRQSASIHGTGDLKDWIKKVNKMPVDIFYGNTDYTSNTEYMKEISKLTTKTTDAEVLTLYKKYKKIIKEAPEPEPEFEFEPEPGSAPAPAPTFETDFDLEQLPLQAL